MSILKHTSFDTSISAVVRKANTNIFDNPDWIVISWKIVTSSQYGAPNSMLYMIIAEVVATQSAPTGLSASVSKIIENVAN